VALGEGLPLGQALAKKTPGEYLEIPKAEDLPGVFERLSSALSQGAEVPVPVLEPSATQAPERVEPFPEQQAEVALPEERPKVAEEVHTFFLFLMIMLLTARLFAEVAARLQAPPVIGELLAGIVLGPSVLGWISPTKVIELLAEIGIILLLFEVGLETDVRKLAQSGAKSFVVASGGFVLPFLLGYGLSRWVLELGMLPSLFVGGTLTATSIGITVRVLSNLKRQASHESQVVLGAAVLDDVFGVVLLALLYEFAIGGGVSFINTTKILSFIALFFVLATPAAKLLSLIIRRFDITSEIPGLLPTTIVALVLFFAWLAQAVGAPELLGGFAAGLALSPRFFLPFGLAIHTDPEFAHRVERQMKPIIHLFTPIFFVMIGLSLNLREVDWGSPFIWLFSLSLVVIATIGKVAGAMLIRESWYARLAIGMAMVPRGEVGLIFAELGRVSGIFDNEIYAGMVIVIALTTLIPPFLMKWFYRRYGERLPVVVGA
jgi:Kef-type K+ transport systems, membrane components